VGTAEIRGGKEDPNIINPLKKVYIFPLDTGLGCWFPWNVDHLRIPVEFIEL